jgi:hypothetical protein
VLLLPSLQLTPKSTPWRAPHICPRLSALACAKRKGVQVEVEDIKEVRRST